MIQNFINGLTLKSVAETLKARVVEENEKEVLRISNLNQRIKNFSGTKQDRANGLIEINGELTGLQTAVLSVLDGTDAKVRLQSRIRKLEYQKAEFESKDQTKTAVVLIEIAQDVLISQAIVALNEDLLGLLDAKIASLA
jgi:hypothetical protein